jgi:hypothetical protein
MRENIEKLYTVPGGGIQAVAERGRVGLRQLSRAESSRRGAKAAAPPGGPQGLRSPATPWLVLPLLLLAAPSGAVEPGSPLAVP